MDKNKGVKIPVQLRVNMWLGLSAHEKKFNFFSEGNFSVYAEMVQQIHFFLKNSSLFFGFSADCVRSSSKIFTLLICSMRTRPRCLGSGEPPVSLVVTSSPMWRERWNSNKSAFWLREDGNGRKTGLLTPSDGEYKKRTLSSTSALSHSPLRVLAYPQVQTSCFHHESEHFLEFCAFSSI